MKDILRHFFIPRESNNHRAKFLHNQTMFAIVILLFVAQAFLLVIKTNYTHVLGVATDISIEKLLAFTNEKRQERGLSALALSEDLSKVAMLKAENMFAKNYWAHNAPDGTTPWVFFQEVKYDYIYAGENLARGFTVSDEVVDAWMASQSHRENMLSKHYQEVGFAVLQGKLLGENTTLVVEMFGSRALSTVANNNPTQEKGLVQSQKLITKGLETTTSLGTSINNAPVIDSLFITRNISFIILSLFIFVFLIDMIIIERKKIVRFVGHNIDHVIFLGGMMVILFIISRGVII